MLQGHYEKDVRNSLLLQMLALLATAEMLCASLTVILMLKRNNGMSEKPDINACLLATKWIMHRQNLISLVEIRNNLECKV